MANQPEIWEPQEYLVRFPDGRQIRGSSSRRRKSLLPPDFGVYLLGRDPKFTDRDYLWVKWRDFSAPAVTEEAVASLREAYHRAANQRVEVGCRGGVGRTGTALAVMAVLGGVEPDAAVPWVRANYHPKAVETPGQRRWLRELLPQLGGPGNRRT